MVVVQGIETIVASVKRIGYSERAILHAIAPLEQQSSNRIIS
ncbi:MAG: hypothetical protein RID09_26270 [Coleofasciculus sp. G1-WW12-02]